MFSFLLCFFLNYLSKLNFLSPYLNLKASRTLIHCGSLTLELSSCRMSFLHDGKQLASSLRTTACCRIIVHDLFSSSTEEKFLLINEIPLLTWMVDSQSTHQSVAPSTALTIELQVYLFFFVVSSACLRKRSAVGICS